MLDFRELRFKPTAITFSPDGNLLAIGFSDGVVWILDAKIEKNIYGKMGESKKNKKEMKKFKPSNFDFENDFSLNKINIIFLYQILNI